MASLRPGWTVDPAGALVSRWGTVFEMRDAWQGTARDHEGYERLRTDDHGSADSAMVAVELMARSRGVE